MKKKVFLILFTLTLIFITVCCYACKEKHYPLKYGAYNFETAIITNKVSKEITEKTFDDILENKEDFKEWGNLLSFDILIDENTEYFCNKDNKYYVLNEGLAFEVIGENTLQLHFPSWRGADLYTYDVVITLGWQKLYD